MLRSAFIKSFLHPPLLSNTSRTYGLTSIFPLHKPARCWRLKLNLRLSFRPALFSALPVEFPLELFHPARGVDKSFFSGIGWVRIAGNIPNHNKVLLPINFFFPVRPHGRTSEELFACRNVDKTDGIHAWLDRLFLLCHYIRGSKVAV